MTRTRRDAAFEKSQVRGKFHGTDFLNPVLEVR